MNFGKLDEQLEAMPGTGNDNEVLAYTGLGQAFGHAPRLFKRHPAVVRTMSQEGGRVVTGDVSDG